MRPLNAQEEEVVMNKLRIFVGDATKELLSDKVLRFNNQKVLLTTDEVLKATSQQKRKEIIIAGTVIGKFTKSNNFYITITSLHALHEHGLHKVWVKASAEMNFLYGNNVLRSHVQKVSEDIPMNAGVFVYNHANVPLGFGILAVGPTSYARARGGDIVVLRQADNGEYIRNELAVA